MNTYIPHILAASTLTFSFLAAFTPTVEEHSFLEKIAQEQQSILMFGITPFFPRSNKELGVFDIDPVTEEIIQAFNDPAFYKTPNGTQVTQAIIDLPGSPEDKKDLWYTLTHAAMLATSSRFGTCPLPFLYDESWKKISDRLPEVVYSIIFSGLAGGIVGAIGNLKDPWVGARVGGGSAAITTGMIATVLALIAHTTRFQFKTMISLIVENLRHLLTTYYESMPDSLYQELKNVFCKLDLSDSAAPKNQILLKKHHILLKLYRTVRKKSEIHSY